MSVSRSAAILARHRVALDVAGFTAESDRRDSVAGRVEHRFDAAGLVGDEYVALGGS